MTLSTINKIKAVLRVLMIGMIVAGACFHIAALLGAFEFHAISFFGFGMVAFASLSYMYFRKMF
ncbi:hypothetical protein [Tranquillimonas alkanivorans]|uniref:Uncharacterized protein n=1 Tax=Tranquillimonas alkanivorans TaxID=441119 RepID=A0A1I5TU68_9RHOB|nr:hypothetical protein [Tranquillimonas alkanivorans]SFP86441.1 hypothetical protein SAMN04488047_11524 [Tranquillimonas alkanivorans]